MERPPWRVVELIRICRFHHKKGKGLFSRENKPFSFFVVKMEAYAVWPLSQRGVPWERPFYIQRLDTGKS